MKAAELANRVGVVVPKTVSGLWIVLPEYKQRNGHVVQFQILATHPVPNGVVYFTAAAKQALRNEGITFVPGSPLRYNTFDEPQSQVVEKSAPVGWAGVSATPFDSDGRIPQPADEVAYSRTATAAQVLAQQ